ncbi:MAG: ribbon-helix-helix domain-containing protein [Thermoplasmata archaeon]|nr:ribbon-helix-helix domain-containing protein [Thermoplasmata archaeon]MCI4337869.1 ribbon-helix-helix domain-containing protein [Thermoplasmata archaeon]MCI4341163.1 ribbon-helix-helix domain-containing protein [Thermoplasmata archaeon]
MFDKPGPAASERARGAPAPERPGPEDERIALRCNRRELQLLDSFVASGEFASRSELMREALRQFLRGRAFTGALIPGVADSLDVPVRLRRDELVEFAAYGEQVANGQPLSSVIAELARRGAVELRVSDLVERARRSVRLSAEARQRLEALDASARELERRGVLGR